VPRLSSDGAERGPAVINMTYNDRIRFPNPPSKDGPGPEHVTVCRSCQSDRITATDSTVTDATYWRCLACGEVWNPARAPVERPVGRKW
jgi:hypothetical protein